MTIAISLDVLQAGVIGLRLHATLTLVGLISTLAAGPLLARARLARGGRAGAGAPTRREPAFRARSLPFRSGGSPTRLGRFGARPGHAQAPACGQSRWSGVSR